MCAATLVPLLAIVAVLTLGAAPLAPAKTASSQALLLSPRVQVGKTFRWEGRILERSVESSIHGPFEHFISRRDAYVCTVLRGSPTGFLVSRRVDAFAPAHQPWMVDNNGSLSKEPMVDLPQPSIIIRGGREFETDGPPLNYDPICKFYPVTMFGVPPPTLKNGSTWHFGQTTFFGRTFDVDGMTTVTKLDLTSGTVTLRVKITNDHGRRIGALVDMVVGDGGEVLSETDRQAYVYVSAIPKEIGTPSWVVVWTLHRF